MPSIDPISNAPSNTLDNVRRKVLSKFTDTLHQLVNVATVGLSVTYDSSSDPFTLQAFNSEGQWETVNATDNAYLLDVPVLSDGTGPTGVEAQLHVSWPGAVKPLAVQVDISSGPDAGKTTGGTPNESTDEGVVYCLGPWFFAESDAGVVRIQRILTVSVGTESKVFNLSFRRVDAVDAVKAGVTMKLADDEPIPNPTGVEDLVASQGGGDPAQLYVNTMMAVIAKRDATHTLVDTAANIALEGALTGMLQSLRGDRALSTSSSRRSVIRLLHGSL